MPPKKPEPKKAPEPKKEEPKPAPKPAEPEPKKEVEFNPASIKVCIFQHGKGRKQPGLVGLGLVVVLVLTWYLVLGKKWAEKMIATGGVNTNSLRKLLNREAKSWILFDLTMSRPVWPF